MSSRNHSNHRRRMRNEDVQAIIDACKLDKTCPFKEFQYTEAALTFEFDGKKEKRWYRVTFCEDYPEQTVISWAYHPAGPFNTDVICDRLPLVFNTLSNDLYKDLKLRVVNMEESNEQPVCVDEKNILSDSEYSDSDYSDYDYQADYNSSEMSPDEGTVMNPLLEADIERVKQLYGEHAICSCPLKSIDDIDVILYLSLKFLDSEIADAWKVIRDEPITIRLFLSMSKYLDGIEPKVEVFQKSQTKENCSIIIQLRKIMEKYVSTKWKRLNNDYLESQLKKVAKPSSILQSFIAPLSRKKLKTAGTLDGVDDKKIAQIVEMGFSVELGRNALINCGGNVEDALNLLLTFPESCVPYVEGAGACVKQPAALSIPAKSLPQCNSSVAAADGLPVLGNGYLADVLSYAKQRLLTLNEHCVVCDEPHLFHSSAMLKPAVCARELCIFSFQTLGVMSDAADGIATGTEVVDLLIAMAIAACSSPRRVDIFDPYPTVVDPRNSKEFALYPKEPDYDRVGKAMNSFPDMQKISTLNAADVKKVMDKNDILAYPLLQWIYVSNRSHIVKLPREKQLRFMGTTHQYLLLSSPPKKEAIFRNAKKEYGSTFAFHGSHIENWHSILRKGLLNASGTKLQRHGRAHGSGIYLSPRAEVSFGYTGSHQRHRKPAQAASFAHSTKDNNTFLNSRNLTCVALCEVIQKRDVLKKAGDIWVMPEPDFVCTRFFFVYEEGQVPESGINTDSAAYRDKINQCVNFRTT